MFYWKFGFYFFRNIVLCILLWCFFRLFFLTFSYWWPYLFIWRNWQNHLLGYINWKLSRISQRISICLLYLSMRNIKLAFYFFRHIFVSIYFCFVDHFYRVNLFYFKFYFWRIIERFLVRKLLDYLYCS